MLDMPANKKNNANRRKFIRDVSLAATGFFIVPRHVLGRGYIAPSDKLNIAGIGAGGKAEVNLPYAWNNGAENIVALCDVDDRMAVNARKRWPNAPYYRDYREMLDKEQLDLVIVATPDHWHALNTIAALKKGCHVFLEKPTGHTILESRAVVEAARASDRVVQVGLHRRIGPHHVSGLKFLKDGNAGKIGMVRMFAHSGGGPELPTPNSKPAEGLDWEMYCGPAPLRPFNRKIHPGARDVPDNGVDENCNGRDSSLRDLVAPAGETMPVPDTFQKPWNVLLITIDTHVRADFPQTRLFDDVHAVISWTGSRYADGIDAEAFCAAGHAVSYFGPARTPAFSEVYFEQHQIERRAEVAVPSFTMLPQVVVGTDRLLSSGYFRAKLAQENLITAGKIPYTIVRATQFFEFVGAIAQLSTDGQTVRLPSAMMQPIAADETHVQEADEPNPVESVQGSLF